MNNETHTVIRVLIVDDHPVFREGLAAMIGSQQDLLLVAEAGTGNQAIEEFERHLPDVTLMDLRLPDISGIEALQAIHNKHSDSKIVVLTTYLGDIQALRALQAGALASGEFHLKLLQSSLYTRWMTHSHRVKQMS